PSPLGPIADAAQANLLCRDHAGLLDLLEGLAALLCVLHLRPTAHMDEALAIHPREATAPRVAPLPPPPRSLGPLAPAPRAGLPGTVGTGRYRGPLNAQHQDRTAKATRCHRGDASLDL